MGIVINEKVAHSRLMVYFWMHLRLTGSLPDLANPFLPQNDFFFTIVEFSKSGMIWNKGAKVEMFKGNLSVKQKHIFTTMLQKTEIVKEHMEIPETLPPNTRCHGQAQLKSNSQML